MIRVKICGITNLADAEAAADAGADALGFVLEPTSPRYVGAEPELVGLVRGVGPFVLRVAVFAEAHRHEAVHEFDCLQGLSDFPEWAVGFRRIRTVRLAGGEELRCSRRDADAILLDAFDPQSFGGTGQTVDWEAAAEAVRTSPLPVILAGGLTPENVAQAVAIVRPYGVDVSSGVEEAPGRKDHGKVRAFIQAARG